MILNMSANPKTEHVSCRNQFRQIPPFSLPTETVWHHLPLLLWIRGQTIAGSADEDND